MVKCTCQQCGNEFDESEIQTVRYQEYEGASLQKDHVSPCCHAPYEYKD